MLESDHYTSPTWALPAVAPPAWLKRGVSMAGFAAVVLAGGSARRMHGVSKPALRVGGEPMLTRVLASVPTARPRVVVGPPELSALVPAGVVLTREDPPGGGPVAAIAAGLACVPAGPTQVAVLAGDLPFISRQALSHLRHAAGGDCDAAVLADLDGAPQWLCGVWRLRTLRARLAGLDDVQGRAGVRGLAVRDLAQDLRVTQVTAQRGELPAWFDCDTEDDLRQAEEWSRVGRLDG